MAGAATKTETGVWLDEDFEVCITAEHTQAFVDKIC
jgi:hypothetical protein